jgi:hypothetical protein
VSRATTTAVSHAWKMAQQDDELFILLSQGPLCLGALTPLAHTQLESCCALGFHYRTRMSDFPYAFRERKARKGTRPTA